MTERKDGGPAFPFPAGHDVDGNVVGPSGMSLRDWFAGQALVGIEASMPDGEGKDSYKDVAESAYRMAAAMLKAREE